MIRRVLALVICALALASCRLDVDVTLVIEPDGTGLVTVEAVADADLVAQVPDLAEALVFDDAAGAGWTIEGPDPTEEGGLRVVATHPVASVQELVNVLNSIGPPFTDMRAGRVSDGDQTTNAIDGTLVLPDGFASFADADLLAAVGGLPFGDRFDAIGASPEESMSFTFRVRLPGEVISSTGLEVEPDVFEWQAPLDGSSVSVATSTVQRPADGGSWAQPLATAAFVALIVWITVSVVLIALVITARRRRDRRRRPPRPPAGRHRTA